MAIRKGLIGAVTLVLLSCGQKKYDFDDYDVTLSNLISGHADDIDKDIHFMQKRVDSIRNSAHFHKGKALDSLLVTTDYYYIYLDGLDQKSKQLKQNLFFKKEHIQEDAKVFLQKSKKFLSDIDPLIEEESIKAYAFHYFNVNDVKNEKDMYFKYLDFYYLGCPYTVFKYLIKKRKYELVLFENELLNRQLKNGNR